MELIIGIMGSIIGAFFCYIFTSVFNVYAKRELKAASRRLSIYLTSIGNDVIWGTDDFKSDYYDDLITKINSAYHYLDKARTAIKPLNLWSCNRKYILIQLDEIEKALEHHLTIAVSNDPENEKLLRLVELKEKYINYNQSILIYRAEYVCELLEGRNLKKACHNISMESSTEKIEYLFSELTRL